MRSVEFNGIGKFAIGDIVKFTNEYFWHAFKES